ncbi:FAD/NAD-P-binding domain-containing protein [Crepidotus variabilis]|uniref:FAD/NAD-P-binding domain-containing protein n=1 Tax=Crepidotus variabilis TaxID=179855 RepID=A0A9P6JPV3_9AGAR|nr:FAD/NAD-P-binding domain-containing protein [Crepidotus variabilis]
MARQNIVIVGGGVAGTTFFKELTPKLANNPNVEVILIDPRSFLVHLPSSIRMVVTDEGNRSILHYPTSFTGTNKRVIQSKVASITDDEDRGHFVTLVNGEQVEFSVLVLATGSVWSGPLTFGDTSDEILETVSDWRKKFRDSRDVVLVGGGAIGFELAGEIKDAYPEARVTIVHTQTLPLNDTYPERWRKRVLAGVEKRGVTVLLGDAVDNFTPTNKKISTRNGLSIPADLVVPTFGSRPNTEYIKTLGPNILNSFGEVIVRPTLQLPDHPRIFAMGDIIDWKEEKQAIKCLGHVKVMTTNTLALVTGNGNLKEYKSTTEMIALSNGKNGGTSYIGMLWGIILGDWLTSTLKSKNLALPKNGL